MLAKGVIEPAMSEWGNLVVIVSKNDGSSRFCVNYWKLNASTIRDAYPTPRIDDCIDSLGKAKIFATLNCNSWYWQIPIKESDRDKTAFVSHMSSYRVKRVEACTDCMSPDFRMHEPYMPFVFRGLYSHTRAHTTSSRRPRRPHLGLFVV